MGKRKYSEAAKQAIKEFKRKNPGHRYHSNSAILERLHWNNVKIEQIKGSR